MFIPQYRPLSRVAELPSSLIAKHSHWAAELRAQCAPPPPSAPLINKTRAKGAGRELEEGVGHFGP